MCLGRYSSWRAYRTGEWGQWAASGSSSNETWVSLEFTVSQAALLRPADGGPAGVEPHMITSMLSIEMTFGLYVTSPDSKRPSQLIKCRLWLELHVSIGVGLLVSVSGCLDFSWMSIMLHILLETAQLPS